MNWYLDTSVIVPLHISEPTSGTVSAVLTAAQSAFIVSTLAAGEFASSVSRRVRTKEATSDSAMMWLGAFDEWVNDATVSLRIDNADITRAAALVRRFELKLLMPDAIHIALCVRHQLVMVTLDKILAEAARTLGIEVVWPGV